MKPPSQGPHVRDFIQSFCRHTKGEWAGDQIKLLPWQRSLIDGLFELDPETGLRQNRIGYIGLPRKNGKSLLCAAFALFGLLADDEPGAEVYSCAGDRQQARIVFEDAKSMVTQDPDLSGELRVYRNYIERKDGNGIYRVLSADAKLQQGLNPSMVIFDEVHVQRNRDLWSAMTLGSGVRRQPLVIGITTAGFDEDTLAYELYEYGKKVVAGEVDDPTFFFRWWEPSNPNADWRDPKVWLECNPMLKAGILKMADFEALVQQTPENTFRQFRCDQWVKAQTAWLPFGAWQAMRSPLVLEEAA